MALTPTTAARYINNIRLAQINEQATIMSKRQRGVNYNQYISDMFPYLYETLKINEVSQVIEPNKRDLIIDFLTP